MVKIMSCLSLGNWNEYCSLSSMNGGPARKDELSIHCNALAMCVYTETYWPVSASFTCVVTDMSQMWFSPSLSPWNPDVWWTLEYRLWPASDHRWSEVSTLPAHCHLSAAEQECRKCLAFFEMIDLVIPFWKTWFNSWRKNNCSVESVSGFLKKYIQ